MRLPRLPGHTVAGKIIFSQKNDDKKALIIIEISFKMQQINFHLNYDINI